MHTLIKQCLRSEQITSDRLDTLLTQFISYMDGLQRKAAEDVSDCQLPLLIDADGTILVCLIEIILECSNNPYILKQVFNMQILTSVHVLPEKKVKIRPLVAKAICKAFADPLLIDTYLIGYDINNLSESNVEPERIKSHYDKLIENNCDMSIPIITDFLLSGSRKLVMYPELALQMIQDVQQSTKDKRVLQVSKAHMCNAYLQYGDFERALECANELVEHLTQVGEFDAVFTIFSICSTVYAAIRNTVKLNELCVTMENILAGYSSDSLVRNIVYYDLLNIRAVTKLLEGDYMGALSYLLEYRAHTEVYWGSKHEQYYAATASIAQAYAKTGDFVEAEKYYAEASQFENDNVSSLNKSIILNNYAVMLIDMNRSGEAIEKLKQSIEILPENVPALAEPYRNMARAYDNLGEEATARKYWSLAYPLLVSNYGETNERTKEAFQHINS